MNVWRITPCHRLPKKDRRFYLQWGPSDGVALEAPIVAFGFLQHLPEGALPLTGLLRNDRKDVRYRKIKEVQMHMTCSLGGQLDT